MHQLNATDHHDDNETTVALSKPKALKGNFDLAPVMGFDFEIVKNIVGKGENAGYQHFLLFLPCFQSCLSHFRSYSGFEFNVN